MLYLKRLLSSTAFIWTTERLLDKTFDLRVFQESFGLATFSFYLFSLFLQNQPLRFVACFIINFLSTFNLLRLNFLNGLSRRAMLSRTSPSKNSSESSLTHLVLEGAKLSTIIISF